MHVKSKGTLLRQLADSSSEILQVRREWHDILKVMEEESPQLRMIYQGFPYDLKEKSKVIQTEAKRVQYHESSFIRNAKFTFLMRKGHS